MKSLRVALLAGSSMLAIVMTQAQTVDEIVAKHIEAVGGKDKINSVKTVYTEYDMDAGGNAASGISYIVNGKGFRNEVDFGGQKIIDANTETTGWTINPMMGQSSATPMTPEQLNISKLRVWVGGPLYEYAAHGSKVELVGKENVGSVSAHKLKLTTKDGAEMLLYIDPATYYIIKAVNKVNANGQDMEISYTYSDFQKNDYGLTTPKSSELALPGFTLTIAVKKVEYNKDIDVKIFDQQ